MPEHHDKRRMASQAGKPERARFDPVASSTTPAQPSTLRCLLLDPSLYTAPYDAALTGGLLAAGVQPVWATRPTRRGDEPEIPPEHVVPLFYGRTDDVDGPAWLRSVAKGLSHLVALVRLIRLTRQVQPDVVHVQWAVLPLIDAAALWLIRLRRPLIMTVHDPTPYNGARLSCLQGLGFDLPISLADQVIVHTRSGRQTLTARGIDARKITVVPHGPLRLRAAPRPRPTDGDPRWTFVLFGEIKPYKGLDVLVEAIGRLDSDVRRRLRVIVAGRPRMDLAPILARIEALSLQATIEVRARRLADQEVADLFAEADCFVFPYREIDASGVYFLTKALGKWLIASRVGVFAEDLVDGRDGVLIPSADPDALASALEHATLTRPAAVTPAVADSWKDIGHSTRLVYERAVGAAQAALPVGHQGRADA
ncbi:MAG: glycosyltransferase [Steroidobacteraceae bacterium]